MFKNLFQKQAKGYQNIDAEQFAQLMTEEDHVVLDVRMPQEKAEGTIPGDFQINFFDIDFSSKITKLDTTKTYLLYCRSGNRSSQACAQMTDMGFENLYNLRGGIGAWKKYKQSK